MCIAQLGELQKRSDDFYKAKIQVVSINVDNDASARLVASQIGATFPLLSDPTLTVTRLFDMQLRAGWPMGGMGRFAEMGLVIVDGKGMIRAQRVDLLFGQTAINMIPLLRSLQ